MKIETTLRNLARSSLQQARVTLREIRGGNLTLAEFHCTWLLSSLNTVQIIAGSMGLRNLDRVIGRVSPRLSGLFDRAIRAAGRKR